MALILRGLERIKDDSLARHRSKALLRRPSAKKVYRSDIQISDAVKIACDEISEIFGNKSTAPETDTDTGFYGDVVGPCPVCGKDVVKGRYGYGCMGYKEGCKFRIGSFICKRTVSITNARKILTEGRSAQIQGFISKNGKPFDAFLKLDGDKVVFEFK